MGVIDVIESRSPAEINTEVASSLRRRSVMQSFEDPAVVIRMAEFIERLAKLGEVSEGTQP